MGRLRCNPMCIAFLLRTEVKELGHQPSSLGEKADGKEEREGAEF